MAKISLITDREYVRYKLKDLIIKMHVVDNSEDEKMLSEQSSIIYQQMDNFRVLTGTEYRRQRIRYGTAYLGNSHPGDIMWRDGQRYYGAAYVEGWSQGVRDDINTGTFFYAGFYAIEYVSYKALTLLVYEEFQRQAQAHGDLKSTHFYCYC
ncbi:hypothetical protein [Sodalis sp. dw_96]|uniref:hypothetical protein n=1 Tax=Sodalis sp. dw_96 TaxID=2719794 RepID=UPI001BD63C35|nr:hypothetical protein [Sodalis sp. dw_96]